VKRYEVDILCISEMLKTFQVRANSEDEATEKALKEAKAIDGNASYFIDYCEEV
jgi:hypothetical protein